jgi:hypothetical protein
MIDKGLEISDGVNLFFGDHKMDVLCMLGNPNKEFYDQGNLFLNYLDLGIDI